MKWWRLALKPPPLIKFWPEAFVTLHTFLIYWWPFLQAGNWLYPVWPFCQPKLILAGLIKKNQSTFWIKIYQMAKALGWGLLWSQQKCSRCEKLTFDINEVSCLPAAEYFRSKRTSNLKTSVHLYSFSLFPGYDRAEWLCPTPSEGAGAIHFQCGGHYRILRVCKGRHCHTGQNAIHSLFCKSKCLIYTRVLIQIWIQIAPV